MSDSSLALRLPSLKPLLAIVFLLAVPLVLGLPEPKPGVGPGPQP